MKQTRSVEFQSQQHILTPTKKNVKCIKIKLHTEVHNIYLLQALINESLFFSSLPNGPSPHAV